jgi:signal transduction histidine kinase
MMAGAIAAIVCACGLVVIWVLNISAASLDHAKEFDETRLMRTVIAAQENALSKAVGDYAAWTELYDYLRGPRHLQWEADNLGPYLAKAFGVDHVFIVRRNGSLRYAYSSGPTPIRWPLPEATQRMLAGAAALAFANERPNKQVAVTGIVGIGGIPSVLAAATIRMSAIAGRPDFVLIEARELSRSYLATVGADYALGNLHTTRDRGTGLALITPSGAPSGYALAWSPARTGRDLFERVLPIVIVFGVVSWFAIAALAFVGWKVMDFIRTSETRALRAVAEANRARALAAEETTRSKSTFIASMSHELRTPLNAIIGFSEFIVSEALGPVGVDKYREYATDIRDSGYHLLNLVNDILQASKIEAGKYEPRIERVAVIDAVRESARITEVLAAKKGIRLHVHIEPPSAQVLADRQALQQVLINVISNAIKFSFEESEVHIGGDVHGSEYELSVSDQGCGIPPETLKEIGKPFVQAGDAYSRKQQGTGLGLAISVRLAEAMHGSIRIDSSVGHGTAVNLRLLLASVEAGFATATAA